MGQKELTTTPLLVDLFIDLTVTSGRFSGHRWTKCQQTSHKGAWVTTLEYTPPTQPRSGFMAPLNFPQIVHLQLYIEMYVCKAHVWPRCRDLITLCIRLIYAWPCSVSTTWLLVVHRKRSPALSFLSSFLPMISIIQSGFFPPYNEIFLSTASNTN